MPDDHIEQEKEINEETLLRSMGIMVPRHRIVHVESEAENKDHAEGSKKDRNKKATATKYENIAKRVKEIWQQHGFGPGEDQRAWHGVLSDIKSMITPLPNIESIRNKVKRVSPAERSKPNQSETETTPELKHEHIDEHTQEVCQQNDCESGEDQQNLTETEDSNINKEETTPELTHELIDDPAKEIWEQSESEFVEDQQNQIEAEVSDVNQSDTLPELTEELIDERAEEIYRQHEYGSGEDEQKLIEAEGSDDNKNETTPELTYELIAEQAEEISQQHDVKSDEDDEQIHIEAEGSDVNKNETTPELTYELIAERAKQIWQQNGCRPGEDQQNWAEAEAQLKAELNID